MHIHATYDQKQACYTAVLEAVAPLNLGDTITITGMTCEDRPIHIDVVKALIHATRDDMGKNFQRNVEEETYEHDDGWTKSTITTRVLHVTCTTIA